ncbi:TetR/AcrR family transcriptional regulator [Glutamicibacter sp. NPDC087344]|uniref:TetR/AcrR family transcriptional regulator n=1 Tax=Glutamicibacter sp. NPDC087344 TaxID=3363994 RepID=UPI00382A0670
MARVSAKDRSRQFIEAAARVIAAEGLAAATTRRIATEADAPLAALHYCFRNKDELLDEVYNYLSRDYARELEPLGEDLSLSDAVRDHLRRIWRRMLASPHEQVTTFELLLRSTRMVGDEEITAARAINRNMYQAWISSTSSIFQAAAQHDPHSPDVDFDLMARMAIAGIDGISLQHLSDPDELRSARLVDALADSIEHLLQAPATAVLKESAPSSGA